MNLYMYVDKLYSTYEYTVDVMHRKMLGLAQPFRSFGAISLIHQNYTKNYHY